MKFYDTTWCQLEEKSLHIMTWTKWLPFWKGHIQVHFLDTKRTDFLIQISLKFVPKGPIHNKSALVQVMTNFLLEDKPLPEPMLTKMSGAISI